MLYNGNDIVENGKSKKEVWIENCRNNEEFCNVNQAQDEFNLNNEFWITKHLLNLLTLIKRIYSNIKKDWYKNIDKEIKDWFYCKYYDNMCQIDAHSAYLLSSVNL